MIYLKQLKVLLIHKWYVFRIGLTIGNIPLWRLLIHDWSKFTPTEFIPYARYKFRDGGRKEWSIGWKHHLHHNPHHPEHWVLLWHGDPKFYSDIGNDIGKYISVLPMPEIFVREMLADMHATSKQISGDYDISRWLNNNGPKMFFHPDTITLIDKIMTELGYFNENLQWSYGLLIANL